MLSFSPKPSLLYIYIFNCLINTYKVDRTYGKRNKNKNQHCLQLITAGPPVTKYLYYPHLEGVTQKGSLLPASVILNM